MDRKTEFSVRREELESKIKDPFYLTVSNACDRYVVVDDVSIRMFASCDYWGCLMMSALKPHVLRVSVNTALTFVVP